jgi:anti-sigma factor RsiW
MTTPCRESVSLGAYLLGALDPEERVAMEAHVATCPHCTRELLELAPLPGLLRHTPFEELPQSAAAAESLSRVREQPPLLPDPLLEPLPEPALEPAPKALPGPVPQPASEPAAARLVPGRATGRGRGAFRPFRARKGRLVVAGAVAAAVVAGAVAYTEVDRSSRPAAVVAAATWSATDPTTHVSATASITPEVWGTEFQLKLGGLPSHITCRLVVHGSDGRSETAGTWGSAYSTSAWIPASTSISPSQITGLDIMSGTGTLLVHVPAS